MRKLSFGEALHLAIGLGGLLFFLGYDLVQGQPYEFGLKQTAGLTVSTIILLAWAVDRLPWDKRLLYGALFTVYLGGILYMGLYPKPMSPHGSSSFLSLDGYNFHDTVINVLGFVPTGFLASAFFIELRRQRRSRAFISAVVFCIAISLAIELVQYGVPGRISSLNDLTANTVGALGGAGFYYFEHWLAHRRN